MGNLARCEIMFTQNAIVPRGLQPLTMLMGYYILYYEVS
jgi:hypothetical protein